MRRIAGMVMDIVSRVLFRPMLWFFVRGDDSVSKKEKLDRATTDLQRFILRKGLSVLGMDIGWHNAIGQLETGYDARINQGRFQPTSFSRPEFADNPTWFLADGEYVRMTPASMRPRLVAQFSAMLQDCDIRTVLEVGGGEAETTLLMHDALGDEIQYFSIDISFGRSWVAHHKSSSRFSHLFVAKGDGAALPFQTNSIDLVFTSHCLEGMPYSYKESLDEILRVARKRVLLVEPTYELGDVTTKLRILAKNQPRGIHKYLTKKNLKIRNHDVLPVQSGSRLSGYHLIELDHRSAESLEDDLDIEEILGCSVCKKPLSRHDAYYYCAECMLVYHIFDGVPNFDHKYALNFNLELTASQTSK